MMTDNNRATDAQRTEPESASTESNRLREASSRRALLARWLTVIARLRPGVTMEQAQTEMSVIARRIEQKYPDRNTGWTTRLTSLVLPGEKAFVVWR